MAGEGIVGLVRAFISAGGRNVLASLWSVASESTAELMRRFYWYLETGQPKDQALRSAQLELLGGPIEIEKQGGQITELDARHPFFWAAFELIGDWR